jgi:hypothetical protein
VRKQTKGIESGWLINIGFSEDRSSHYYMMLCLKGIQPRLSGIQLYNPVFLVISDWTVLRE